MQKTSTACAVTENGEDYISGMLGTSNMDRESQCEDDCTKYPWCKGIRKGRGLSGSGYQCQLLTPNNPGKIPGWLFINSGSWAEPNNWKNSNDTCFRCFIKTKKGEYGSNGIIGTQ